MEEENGMPQITMTSSRYITNAMEMIKKLLNKESKFLE